MANVQLLQEIQHAVRTGDYRFTLHAAHEATADEYAADQVRDAIISERAEIVEDYPDDARGTELPASWLD